MNLYSNFSRNHADLKCERFRSSETTDCDTIKFGFRKIVFKIAVCDENETICNYGGKRLSK